MQRPIVTVKYENSFKLTSASAVRKMNDGRLHLAFILTKYYEISEKKEEYSSPFFDLCNPKWISMHSCLK